MSVSLGDRLRSRVKIHRNRAMEKAENGPIDLPFPPLQRELYNAASRGQVYHYTKVSGTARIDEIVDWSQANGLFVPEAEYVGRGDYLVKLRWEK